jgi:hypothetical protein
MSRPRRIGEFTYLLLEPDVLVGEATDLSQARQGASGSVNLTRIGAFPNAPAAASSTHSPHGLGNRVSIPRKPSILAG